MSRFGRRTVDGWWAANRGRVTLLLVAGVALGGIVCMVLIVLAIVVGRT